MASYGGDTSFGSVTIKVAPEVLQSKASDIRAAISSLRQKFDSIKKGMERTRSYWEGDAGAKHRDMYVKQQPAVDEMLKKLESRVLELEQIAANYTSAEIKNVGEANALATDVIQ